MFHLYNIIFFQFHCDFVAFFRSSLTSQSLISFSRWPCGGTKVCGRWSTQRSQEILFLAIPERQMDTNSQHAYTFMIDEYAIHIIMSISWCQTFHSRNGADVISSKDGIFQCHRLCGMGEYFWHMAAWHWMLNRSQIDGYDGYDHTAVRYCARNGISPRDGELLKRAMTILRHFHHVLSAAWQQLPWHFFGSPDSHEAWKLKLSRFVKDPQVSWLPFYPVKRLTAAGQHVYASKFVLTSELCFVELS